MFIPRLSMLTTYYVRRLIHRYRKNLQSVVVSGGSIKVDLNTDLDLALADLYLELDEIRTQVDHVEVLVRRCQQLVAQGAAMASQQKQIERDILWVFGLKITENNLPPIQGIYIIEGGKSKQVSLKVMRSSLEKKA
jgi:hypothetical protein